MMQLGILGYIKHVRKHLSLGLLTTNSHPPLLLCPSSWTLRIFCHNLRLSSSCPIIMHLMNMVHVREDKRWHLSCHLFSFWPIHYPHPPSCTSGSGALITPVLGMTLGYQPVFISGLVSSLLRMIIFLLTSCVYSSLLTQVERRRHLC